MLCCWRSSSHLFLSLALAISLFYLSLYASSFSIIHVSVDIKIGTLRSNDADGNENVKKNNRFD